ncbi:SGNH/GDSL hydrolase family protein [uncultured Jatrophihabitans sp.]|uniref:SGNH/GDSL hydrolase family protein n=1 Tax=uncultured Jatrophihabitans sp. TaxID=1610747 RepID=UPI0035C99F43
MVRSLSAMMTELAFDYANVTGRPRGAIVATVGRVLPGVAEVQRQVQPYAAAWRAANLAALSRPGRRWIVLGDSMSQGIGADPFAGWVNQLLDRLPESLNVVNLSASGARVPDLLEQQMPVWRALPAAAPGAAPDIVTVLVGSNDLMSRRHRDAMPELFGQLLEQLPPGAIVATLPQPRAAAAAANKLIDAAARTRGLRVVDMRKSGPRSWRGKLAADHFHPNEIGYASIADAFEPAVRKAVAAPPN